MFSILKIRQSNRAINEGSSDNSVSTHTSLASQAPHTSHKPKIALGDRLPQLPAIPNLPNQARATVKRLMPDRPSKRKRPDLDVLIIGAGISGVDMACYLRHDKVLSKSISKGRVAIVEKRASMGGTWDLFRYPGVRSDSDMTTFGFGHRPWRGNKTLADGGAIKAYIEETAEDEGIESLIEFNTKMSKLEWSSKNKFWSVTLVDVLSGEVRLVTSRFVVGATGYYDFEAGHEPTFAGEEVFKGQIIHPQKWSSDVDYDGKRVVVIGSGATAVTMLPALLDASSSSGDDVTQGVSQVASHVTMLQRSPTYMGTVPGEDNSLDVLTSRLRMNEKTAYSLMRWRNILMQQGLYRVSKVTPTLMRKLLLSKATKALEGSSVGMDNFTPDYAPWDERLCAVPDGDFFEVMHTGRADVVTDGIERFTETGILLKSGKHLDVDLIVTATGLKLQMLGGAEVYIDGRQVNIGERITYKAVLVENVPNMAVLFGYTNASWTLKIDLACLYITRLLRHMYRNGYTTVMPSPLADDNEVALTEEDTVMGALTAGYIRRAKDVLPKQGDRYPWFVTNNYLSDIVMLKHQRIKDKWLRFG